MSVRSPFLTAAFVALLTAAGASPAGAEAVFDGSVGPQGNLSGDMIVDDSYGTQVGGNLFHSFSTLNVNPGESLTFTSGFAGVTDNVISRVTGSTSTLIDGPVFSAIPNSSLWLINPNGLVFGEGAFVDVQGGFHASTADYLLLDDGGRFGTDLSLSGNTTLTVGNPVSFGFLTDAPASIEVNRTGLFVPYGETLELVGGDLRVESGFIGADGGTLALAAVASPGEVALTDDGFDVGEGRAMGDIRFFESGASASGEGGGAVFIRGGQFVMEQGSRLDAETWGFEDGRGIDLEIDDLLVSASSGISTVTYGPGAGGDIDIWATGSITVEGGSAIDARVNWEGDAGELTLIAGESILIDGFNEFGDTSFVGGPTFGPGDGSNILFDAPVITVSNGAYIWGSARDSGSSGDITINASESVNLVGTTDAGFSGGIFANTTTSADASDVTINTRDFNMLDAAYVVTRTRGAGKGGDFTVNAEGDATFAGTGVLNDPSYLWTGSGGPGTSGDVTVNAENMYVLDGAQIGTFAPGPRDAGTIVLNIRDTIIVEGTTTDDFGTFYPSRLDATGRDGDAGEILVSAREIFIGADGHVTTESFGEGTSGDISLEATDLFRMGGGDELAFVFAESFSTPLGRRLGGDIKISAENINIMKNSVITTAGEGGTVSGNIDIHASDQLVIAGEEAWDVFINSEGAFNPGASGDINLSGQDVYISTAYIYADVSFTPAQGGTISVDAENSIVLDNEAYLSSVSYFADLGGNVRITAPQVTLKNGGWIATDTYGFGKRAGDIYVTADDLTLMDGGTIDSNSCFCAFGDAGSIFIDVNTLTIDGYDGLFAPPGVERQETGLRSESFGSGRGGNINVKADTVVMKDGGRIEANVESTKQDFIDNGEPEREPGDAGFVAIDAREIQMTNATIETNATESAGGSIEITLTDQIYMTQSEIAARADGVRPDADGGNISISNPDFIILEDSRIIASANAGNGGNILLTTGALIPNAYSEIDASSRRGLDGRVVVESPNDLVASVTLLNAPDFDVSEFAEDPCEILVDRERSSFTIEGRGGVPSSPDDYSPSPISSLFDEDRSDAQASATPPAQECR
jgi:filamentous hemagglutinin family protein